jgi:CheY-like chemotaxis protein
MDRVNGIILCVDDEENALTLRRLVLEKAGYKVITACGAEQALEVLSSHRVDLVLSDYLMPGLSGAQLARQIKMSLPNLPVILYSGVNEVPADAHCSDLFLSKVAGPAVLCEKISAILAEAKQKEREELGFP